MDEKIKILYLSASPKDQPQLKIDEEFRGIYEKLDRKSFELISVSKTLASEIQVEIVKNKPAIVHFSGHASVGEIFLETAAAESRGVPKNALVKFFNDLSKKPRLVFFNACQTADNLTELTRFIDFVIATSRAVVDETAVYFATKFYEYLSLGEDVETAFNHALNEPERLSEGERRTREATLESSRDDGDVYRLFTRAGVRRTIFVKRSKKKRKKKTDGGIIFTRNEIGTNTVISNAKFRDLAIKK